MEKGKYGYMFYYRKKHMIISIVLGIIIVVAFLFVYSICGTTKHPLVLLPILCALPFAKQVVSLIVVAKYKALSKEEREELVQAITEGEICSVLYDLALSSRDAISYIPCMVIKEDAIYALYGGSNSSHYGKKEQLLYITQLVEDAGYTKKILQYENMKEMLIQLDKEVKENNNCTISCERIAKRILSVCV